MRVVLALSVGFVLTGAGVVLLIPLPEVGLPMILGGLRLLGRRYAWARAANERVDEVVRAARRGWRGLRLSVRRALVAALLIGLAAGTWQVISWYLA
jgi:TRAP-type C4-dicarboxylate transport system permease small subunit